MSRGVCDKRKKRTESFALQGGKRGPIRGVGGGQSNPGKGVNSEERRLEKFVRERQLKRNRVSVYTYRG